MPVPTAQIMLALIIIAAFAAGYGLRAFISYRRRRLWKASRGTS